MKIALYLGSFDPFHNGHLNVIKQAFDNFKMDAVVIVPTIQNPWKIKPLDIDKRIGIIHSAFYFDRKFYTLRGDYNRILYKNKIVVIDPIEKFLTPPFYSYATLHALKNKYCYDDIYILCGEDTIKDISNWMNGEAILQDYNFLICDRSKDSVSSTLIKKLINNNEDISDYVNKHIVKLINKYYK